MAPNVKVDENSKSVEVANFDVKARFEILYDGYFYDVTNFIDRHPGGDVIKFYLEPGEDATHAVEQFHFRSKKKVETMLRSFKKRPALPQDLGLEPDAARRHEALSSDFKNLFEELKAEGFFEPCIPQVILRLIECSVITLLGYGVIFRSEIVMMKVLGTLLIGFGMSRYGWLQHEGGHRSLTGNRRIDQMIQDFGQCLVIGGSSHWWNSSHVKHHAMPQRIQHDVDLETLPFVAFHKKLVKDKRDYNIFFVKYQHIFFATLDMLLVGIALKFYIIPRHQFRNKAYMEMLLNLPSIIAVFYISPVYVVLVSYFFSLFMAGNLFLNHTHLEVTEEPKHWIEYSLTHTANITPSMFVDYWMAYLNYQIEHHLFPTMPQFRHKEISHRVKALADRHGLPYRVLSYPEACKLAFKNLNDVGNELTGSD